MRSNVFIISVLCGLAASCGSFRGGGTSHLTKQGHFTEKVSLAQSGEHGFRVALLVRILDCSGLDEVHSVPRIALPKDNCTRLEHDTVQILFIAHVSLPPYLFNTLCTTNWMSHTSSGKNSAETK